MFTVVFSKQAAKDAEKIARAGFKERVLSLISILQTDPFKTPPPYEKLKGNLSGF